MKEGRRKSGGREGGEDDGKSAGKNLKKSRADPNIFNLFSYFEKVGKYYFIF